MVINRAMPAFLKKYKTTINIQFSVLENITVDWHMQKEVQDFISYKIEEIDREIELVKKQIEIEKTIKKYYLSKMFC